MMLFTHPRSTARSTACQLGTALGLACLLSLALLQPSQAAEPQGAASDDASVAAKAEPARKPAAEAIGKDLASQVREAVKTGDPSKKRLTLVINGKEQILPIQAPRASEPAKNEPVAVVAPAIARKPPPATHVRVRPVTAS